ncbi:hypothetical protein MRX96_035510 [Rhipicephalus microplus]
MAFQRPFLIILKREEPGQPWGFRVSGGADLATPPQGGQAMNSIVHRVSVSKKQPFYVVDGGLAALQGMHEGDLIIQVGKHNVQDLTETRINSLLAQPAKRLEVFIVREDFLQKPRKGEPSTVKAVVHNQYNSPLQLYSQEKVAETLAYHAQAITAEDGVNNIQPVGLPQNLVRSAVLQALSEDDIGGNPYRTANGTTAVQRTTAPPTPPPKPRPPSYSGGPPQPERPYSSSGHHQPSYQQFSYQQPAYEQQPVYHQQPASYPVQHARQSSYEEVDQRQQQIREAELRQRQYEEERLQQAQYEEGRFRQPPQDFRRVEFEAEQRRLREEEERRRRVIQEEENKRRQEENAQREPLNVQQAQKEAQRRFQPSAAVASSPQHQEQVGSQAQRWETRIWEEQQARMPGTPLGSPTVSRRARDNVWPPKESSVRWTPKTGFSPQLTRQSSQGAKQFVWPPPKSGVANGDDGGFPYRPPSRSAVNAWHPPQSPTSGSRTPPFARSPSLGRRTRDIAWPPPQPEAPPPNSSQYL